MNLRDFARIAVLAALASAVAVTFAAPATALPAGFRVHGFLAAQAGPVPDGAYPMTFRLYAAVDASAALFKEIQIGVPVKAGGFAVVVGAEDPAQALPPDVFEKHAELWLGVQVSVEPELPRVPLHAVPWAFHAGSAQTLTKPLSGNQIVAGSLPASAVAFTYAKSDTKGGDALGLSCTGCVTAAHLAADALDAKNVTFSSGGKTSTVQTELGKMLGALKIDGLSVGIGKNPGNVCALDVGTDGGEACVDGAPALWTRFASSDNEMQQYGKDGQLVYRKDDGSAWMRSKGAWRRLAYVAVCGDGFVDVPEQCDDGKANADAPDKCRTTCALPKCGDKIVDTKNAAGLTEACDDGNQVTTDACIDCAVAKCGDGFVQAGVEQCDNGAANGDAPNACRKTCVQPKCGDGIVDSGEACDDGNQVDGDQCSNSCKVGCANKCSNGSCTDCNAAGSTLVASSAFVDPNPPSGWVQCAGWTNTAADDVSAAAPNNCLGMSKFRIRIFDPSGNLTDDVYKSGSTVSAWPSSASYWLGGSSSLTMAKCGNKWPCNNTVGFYGATNGTGGGGCTGYASGGMTFSNGNGGQVTASPADVGGKEIWQGPCYGNTEWIGWKVALYK